jgi:hypothetical protein
VGEGWFSSFRVNVTMKLFPSIAGLAAARVCHSHFDKVVIVEPEAWLATAEAWDVDAQKQNARSRLMQYKSFHGMYLGEPLHTSLLIASSISTVRLQVSSCTIPES